MFEIKLREDNNPFLARIIITDNWDGRPEESKTLLEDICQKWPKGKKVKFIMSCGGFIQFGWPEFVSRKDVGDNKNPNIKVVETLVNEAEKYARDILSNNLREKLCDLTDYITLGIDSYKDKISTTQNYISQLHIELVFLVDLIKNKFYWTGKSYPTPNQQAGLVRIHDLKTHFFNLDCVGKLMILGCHDLTIFNPRSKNAKGWRKDINREFKELAANEKPICVLQHPHTTVKIGTWRNAWSNLSQLLPSVKQYFGAGRYYESESKRSECNNLDNVLERTKYGETMDFIVSYSK